MRVAYIRVSTQDQDPERQRRTIESSWDIDEWFADVEHGDVLTGRDGLDELMSRLDEIDEVVIDEPSRLGRTITVRDTVEEMRQHGVTIHFEDRGQTMPPGDEELDFAVGMWWDFTTRQAQEELRHIRRRTQAGIDRAIEDGKHVGNVPTGFRVEDGFLQPDEKFERVNQFVREVNRGRSKRATAEWFGFNPNSAQSILRTTTDESYPYDERYVGDEEWRRRRADVENGDRDLVPLGDGEPVEEAES